MSELRERQIHQQIKVNSRLYFEVMEGQESGIDLGYDISALMENADINIELDMGIEENLGTIKSRPIIER